MTRDYAISRLRTAKRHISETERYRFWPLYAACLAAFMYSTWFWPWDMSVINTMADHRWTFWLQETTWQLGLAIVITLGIVGLFRSSCIARGLAIYALWFAQLVLRPYHWEPLLWLKTEFLWYTFDLPAKLIHGAAGEGTAAATMFWLLYWTVVWFLVRPLLKRAYTKVRLVETWILERWPETRRFARPVM